MWNANIAPYKQLGSWWRGEVVRCVLTYNEDGHEACQCGVPVATGRGRGLSHKHAVEDEVPQAKLDTPCGRERDAAVRVETVTHHVTNPRMAVINAPTRGRDRIYRTAGTSAHSNFGIAADQCFLICCEWKQHASCWHADPAFTLTPQKKKPTKQKVVLWPQPDMENVLFFAKNTRVTTDNLVSE